MFENRRLRRIDECPEIISMKSSRGVCYSGSTHAKVNKELGGFARFACHKLKTRRVRSADQPISLIQGFDALSQQLADAEKRLELIAENHEGIQRLQTIPGVGPRTAEVIVTAGF
jgi:DNA uptake protein ComE-like DNA-binding protein